MKRLKVVPKVFLQIFSILIILIVFIHLMIFLLFPRIYIDSRKSHIVEKSDEIARNLNGRDIKFIEETLDFYSKNSDIGVFIKNDNDNNSLPIKNTKIDLNSSSNSLIIEDRVIELNTGEKVSIQFVSTTDINKEAKKLSFKFLPYSLIISFILSIGISIVYAKLMKKEEIIKLERLKYDFFRGASHELKTPLASLKIILENMQYNIGKYKDRDFYIGECIGIVDKLNHNISQILLISKLENLKDDQENINIGIVLNEIMDKYSVLIKNKNIKFSNNLDGEELYIGKSGLNIVLSNLINNAVNYSDNGGVINVGSRDGWFYLENSCDSEINIDNLFEMKFDLNKKNSNGMGLYIVSRILSNYGIEYRIEKSDIGFVFLIKL